MGRIELCLEIIFTEPGTNLKTGRLSKKMESNLCKIERQFKKLEAICKIGRMLKKVRGSVKPKRETNLFDQNVCLLRYKII